MPSDRFAGSALRIGLVQMAMRERPEDNMETARDRVAEAARAGARVVCLPELYRTRYFCQQEDAANFDLAETIPGPSTEALSEVCRTHAITVIAPLFERRGPGLYHNTVAVIDAAGDVVGLYRKMHIPDDPAFYEKFYFAPGDLGFPVFDVAPGEAAGAGGAGKSARLGVLICWDQWYPEAARLVALRGATLLFYPTAIGWHPHEKAEFGAVQRDAWRTVQRGHAIANGIFVAACNRVGFEPAGSGPAGLEFWGTSFVCDPSGVVQAEASIGGEEILLHDLDLARVDDVRRNWPFLRDRRIDAYGGLDRRFLD